MSKPTDIGSVKIGHYIIIEGEPCKIVEYEKSKPGKHGSAKARIVAIGLYDSVKRSLVSPVDGRTEVPIIEKETAQVISIGATVQLMNLENYQVFEAQIPEDEEIKEKLASGIEVEYWKILDRVKIVRVKGAH
ncbi:MAG: translation initiation factor IF-5A [Candidatus Bathyarchaeota archaeon]